MDKAAPLRTLARIWLRRSLSSSKIVVKIAGGECSPCASRANLGRLEWFGRDNHDEVQALEEEIERLSPEELAELRVWLVEREADEWDREIERDAASGKLDKLFEKSVQTIVRVRAAKFEALHQPGFLAVLQPTSCGDPKARA